MRIVHYLNQFFGGIGGEDKADFPPQAMPGVTGPGRALQQALGKEAEVVGTVICGDGLFADHMEQAAAAVLKLIEGFAPDVVIAGPAFNAGRYGLACGRVCADVATLSRQTHGHRDVQGKCRCRALPKFTNRVDQRLGRRHERGSCHHGSSGLEAGAWRTPGTRCGRGVSSSRPADQFVGGGVCLLEGPRPPLGPDNRASFHHRGPAAQLRQSSPAPSRDRSSADAPGSGDRVRPGPQRQP